MQFNPNSTSGIVYMTRFYAKANSNDLTLQDIVNLSNNSLDEINGLLKPLSRVIVFDDPYYGDDPYETYDITSGTSRLSLETDDNSAAILGIKKIAVADSSGEFRIVDITSIFEEEAEGFVTQSNLPGVPVRALLFGTSLVWDPTPNYTYAGGARIFYDRALHHFTSSDTTAEPGFDHDYHELVPMMNAYKWCRREGKRATADDLKVDIIEMKLALKTNFGHTAGEGRAQRMKANVESTK